MEACAWAHREFEDAKLPDLRLRRRLVSTAALIRENPRGTLPRAVNVKAALKGAYRLFAHKSVTYENVLQPHLCRTRLSCREPGEYLLIEDTTELSFSHRGNISGMGPLTKKSSQGFLAHTCLAARIERWSEDVEPEITVPGLFGQECWVREIPKADRKQRKKKKRQQKAAGNYSPESERWGRAVFAEPSPPEETRWTLVADRESDIFSLMARCQTHGVEFILRAAQGRKVLPGGQDVFDAGAQAPVLGRFGLSLRARPGVAAREAVLEVRAVSVIVKPPRENPGRLAPLPVNLVEVREVDAPHAVAPVHWLLFASWACAGFTQALRVARGYASRWLIEEYHKAVKTGTHVEDSQLSAYDRVSALFAIHAVVAVDLLNLKLLARTCPDEPITDRTISPETLEVLEKVHGRPQGGWTNDALMRTIACMGGYQNRRNDGPPGWISIWRGWRRLTTMAEGYMLAKAYGTYG